MLWQSSRYASVNYRREDLKNDWNPILWRLAGGVVGMFNLP